jgi:hypothetical protein
MKYFNEINKVKSKTRDEEGTPVPLADVYAQEQNPQKLWLRSEFSATLPSTML